MVTIKRADESHASLLSEVAILSFNESHGNSAKPQDIKYFTDEKYNIQALTSALNNPDNNYYLIYYENRLAGFTNLIYNSPYDDSIITNIAKLERIYVLKEFYNLKLGYQLLEFNINIAREHNQKAIWLFVWTENERAMKFYMKSGFKINGSGKFKISETHANPNHRLYLEI